MLRSTRSPRDWKSHIPKCKKLTSELCWPRLQVAEIRTRAYEGAKHLRGKKRVSFLAIYFPGGRAKKKRQRVVLFRSSTPKLFWVERRSKWKLALKKQRSVSSSSRPWKWNVSSCKMFFKSILWALANFSQRCFALNPTLATILLLVKHTLFQKWAATALVSNSNVLRTTTHKYRAYPPT